ncbi:Lysophospholipase L1 [Flavobacterium flevense]|uniref:Sialate O-acetylesterase n=1 Tax=Flavobacterium flevense TaxID=983 RepID=A0A4Y4B1B4_9FLAO|nr:GDSL-type esterase/lipase family protein [Flavobacterium flevense]GEC72887.1 sialate O-acetylesterase [Flavobacterium flevense]SHL60048.1 Lysophospholipase L1 [Flavobacterium flevense]
MLKKQLFLFSLILVCEALTAQTTPLTDKQKAKLYPHQEIVSRYHNNWTQKHYRQRIALFEKEPLETGDIVFIGNSITEKIKNWDEAFNKPHVRNRGIAGDLTDGVLKRLNEIVYFKPKAVFIMIGINDLFNKHHKEDTGKLKYDKIIPSAAYVGENILNIAKKVHRQSPDTKIYVRTVLPTRRAYLKQDIVVVNTIIKKNEAKGYYQVLDFYSEFVDANGDLFKELTVDGVHLNDKGYEKWINFEKPIMETL